VLGEVADELADLEWVGERVYAEDFDGSGGGGEESEEDADERGLAGAVGADEADDAGVEVESERVEGGYAGVALGYIVGTEEGHGPEGGRGALETTELGRGWFRILIASPAANLARALQVMAQFGSATGEE
jgi:hypothetical protein